ncbi:MAG: YigZ family protein [Eubacteriales bacterium]|jgi:uncharacterized YigZ family protein|nr:YigZ family protein [Eubacteriales bacterium]MCI6979050.1 YigZ family protein [Clostridiales bacterium]MDD6721195.1 YigZ family protein [Clostridiales bacterium]MDY5694586.1 YigZ family protein [Eubacteriales bacterium]HZK45657.1 YigZ family protein [Clostridia bacterium]
MRPYKTVHIEAKTERVINRSRFISQCFPVKTEEEALLRLSEVKKQYPDATHVCYAYRIGENSETTRFSDAGEPSGTAGMPILEVLKAKGLTYVLCTVTRYFGGILLGAGGLVRAYSSGAADASAAAGADMHLPGVLIKMKCDYSRYGAIESLMAKSNASIIDTQFTDEVQLSVSAAKEDADAIIKAVIERTDGRCKPEIAGECELVIPC